MTLRRERLGLCLSLEEGWRLRCSGNFTYFLSSLVESRAAALGEATLIALANTTPGANSGGIPLGSRPLIIRCGSVTQTAHRPAFAECHARATCRWRRGNDVAPREMRLQFVGCTRSRDHHQALFKRAFADFSRCPLLSLKSQNKHLWRKR